VSSEWKTDGAGPAKRVYELTPEGEEVLDLWVAYMQGQADALLQFIERYHNLD
jgi:DNA-binding PadR family transcriptional regulator